MRKDTIIKYAWRHGGLDAEEFDSLDGAVSAAIYAADYGEESLECIEVIDATGASTVHDDNAVWDMGQPIRDARDAAYDAAPKTIAAMEILSPLNGKAAIVAAYTDGVAAEAGLVEWRERVGEARASLRWYGVKR